MGIITENYEREKERDRKRERERERERKRKRERERGVRGAQSKPNPSTNSFPKLWDARV